MVKVYKLPDLEEQDFVWSVEILQQFKSPGQLSLELCFDPSSRFLAVGTSDSQIKVYDIQKGFQTHVFKGHRGVITQLKFFPQENSLQLASSGEDLSVQVWDLVLNS